MAYGLKYQGFFTSTKYGNLPAIDYTVKLEFLDFTGSVTELKINGFSESQKGNDGLLGLKETTFEFGVITETLGIKDFYPDSERHVKVLLYKTVAEAEVLVRAGFLSEDNPKQNYVDGKQIISITATDGLALLKGKKYQDENGKAWHSYPYAERATILKILARCFEQIGLGLNFNTAFNVCGASDTPSANFDIMAFRERGQKDLAELSVYDILDSFSKSLNCQLFQEDGEWWFVHLLGQRNGGQFFRKWSNAGAYISGGAIADTVNAGHDQAIQPLAGGVLLLEKPYKRVLTEVELKEYVNSLLNPTFVPDGSGGYDNWELNTLTAVNGGTGTEIDPYYLEIDGYQTGVAFDRVDYKGVYQTITLGNVANGDSLEQMVRRQVRVKGRVIGKDVKTAFLGVYLTIGTAETDHSYYLSSDGNWNIVTEVPLVDAILSDSVKRDECIEVNLIDKDGVAFTKYSTFDVLSESVKEAADSKYPWYLYGIGGSGFSGVKGLSSDDFEELTVTVVLYTGFERTDEPIGGSYDTYVRFANLDLQIQDTLASQRSEKIKYILETSETSSRELTLDRALIDFDDNNQSIAITKSAVPTAEWVTNDDDTPLELVEHLNKEVLYAAHLPQSIFEGDIKGLVSRRVLLQFYGITAPSILVSWSYDFYDSIATGVRYQKLWDTVPTYTSEKYGVQADGREIAFSEEGLPSIVYNDDDPARPHGGSPVKNTSKTGIHNGNLAIEKGEAFSGAVNFLDSAGLVTDYLKPKDDGSFYLKTAGNDEVAIATAETAWMLGATNVLIEKGFIGSESGDFDIGIKVNGSEIATFKSDGNVLLPNQSSYKVLGTSSSGAIQEATSSDITSLIGTEISSLNYWTKTGNNLSYSSSNVGIGTTNPLFPLSLGSTGVGNKLALYETGSGNGYGFGVQNSLLQIFANGAGDRVGIGYGSSTNFTETFTVRGNRVAIGTAAPYDPLHIFTNSDRYGFRIGSTITYLRFAGTAEGEGGYGLIQQFGGGGNLVLQRDSGNVLIGSATPVGAYKLEITGDSYFSGNVDVNSTTKTADLKITDGAAVGKVWQCNNVDGSGIWTSPLTSERYIGEWDATSGVPDASPTSGDYYVVNVAGTYNSVAYSLGDEIYYDGTSWLKRGNYLTLPIATGGTLGGVKIGSRISISSGVISADVAAWSDITGKPTTIGGYGITDAYSKAEADAEFIDFGNTQTATGQKTFSGGIFLDNGVAIQVGGVTKIAFNASFGIVVQQFHDLIYTDFNSTGQQERGQVWFDSRYSGWYARMSHAGLRIGSGDIEATETIDIDGNFKYSGLLKPSGTAGTNNQVLSTDGVNDAWTTLATSHLSDWSTAWDAKIATFIGAAPAALDTWLELVAEIQSSESDINDLLTATAANTSGVSTLDAALNISSLSDNYIPKWDGEVFVDSAIKSQGSTVYIYGSLRQTGVTSSLLMADADGKLVAADHGFISTITQTNGSFERVLHGSYLCEKGDESLFVGYDETSGMPSMIMSTYDEYGARVDYEEYMDITADVTFRRVLVDINGNERVYAFLDETISTTDITSADSIANLSGTDIMFSVQESELKNFDLYALSAYLQSNLQFGSEANSFGLADIAGQTELTSGLEATDELVLNDGGSLKRMDVSVLQTYMQDNLTFSGVGGIDEVLSEGNTATGKDLILKSTYGVYESTKIGFGDSLSNGTYVERATIDWNNQSNMFTIETLGLPMVINANGLEINSNIAAMGGFQATSASHLVTLGADSYTNYITLNGTKFNLKAPGTAVDNKDYVLRWDAANSSFFLFPL